MLIFDGLVDANLCVRVLEDTLLPSVLRFFPDRHLFMQDNDPKHMSRCARPFFEEKGIVWWKNLPISTL